MIGVENMTQVVMKSNLKIKSESQVFVIKVMLGCLLEECCKMREC